MAEPNKDTMGIAEQYQYAIARAEEDELTRRLNRVRQQRYKLEATMARHIHAYGPQRYELLSGIVVKVTHDPIAGGPVKATFDVLRGAREAMLHPASAVEETDEPRTGVRGEPVDGDVLP